MKNKILLLLVFGLIMTTQMIYAQTPYYIPTNGLVGYWPFNGNANDQSGNGLNGIENNMIYDIDRNGNINSCLNINGNTNRWIDVAISNQTLVNQQSKTFSMWVKLPVNYTGISYYNHIITMANLPWMQVLGNYPTYISNGYVNKFVFNGQLPVSNQQFNDNLWHNIIVVCDGNFNMELYLDGLLVGNQSFPSTNNFTNLNQIRIGNNLSNFSQCAFAGQIDDIGIWNRTLTQQEITNMYNGVNYSNTCNSVSGSLVNGLVGYWPFCGNANDQSGNGNNGTVNGATLTTDRFGDSSSSYLFNNNSRIKINYNNSLNTTTGTISAWIYVNTLPTSNDPQDLIFGKGWGFPQLIIRNDGKISLATMNSQSTATFIQSTSTISQGNWYHILGYYSSNSFKLYINGVLDNSIIPSPTPTFYSYCNSEYWIGGFNHLNSCIPNDNVQNFNGVIDDIGFWNRELTQQEITQLYNQNQCITNITVTDTLIINVGQVSYINPVVYANNITIYPNPANTQVNISFNNITDLAGGSIKIVNSLGQQVATTPITISGTNTTLPLNTWGGTGLYYVQILNAQGTVVDVKKIILQ